METVHAKKRFFLDTEFMEDGKTIILLSIGVVSEDGREFYLENSTADWGLANSFVKENVLPHLRGASSDVSMPHYSIGVMLEDFVAADPSNMPEFWAWYGAYDWVAVCQLFGAMVDKPSYWPMFCMDVQQLCESLGNPRLPIQTSTAHHALADAYWTREAWQFLTKLPGYKEF